MMMYKFTRHFFSLKNGEYVIIGNKYRGTYLKLSAECYQILTKLMCHQGNMEEFNDIFERQEDKEYFSTLKEILLKKEILVDFEEKEYIENIDIQWEITQKCNLSCAHCIANAMITKTEESYDDIKKIADKILMLNPTSLTITGGEPMILKCFWKISEYIRKKYSGELILMTNGTMINSENVSTIANVYDEVEVSIDGVDENSCSVIRGKGVFHKVIESIELLKQLGVKKVSLSMVLTNENQKFKEKFYSLCNELEVRPQVRAFAPIGRGAGHTEWYISSSEDISEELISEECKKSFRENQPKEQMGACEAEYGSFTIDEKGNIGLCAPFQELIPSVGNIKNIEDICNYIRSEKYKETKAYKIFKHFLPENKEECKNCNVRYFCWSCPFINEQALKNDKYYKNYCRNRKKDLSLALWGETI